MTVQTAAPRITAEDSGPGFADAVEFGAGETLTSPLPPGFALAVDELFVDLG